MRYRNSSPSTLLSKVGGSSGDIEVGEKRWYVASPVAPLGNALDTTKVWPSTTSTVDVVSDDFNPFQDQGVPLRLVEAEIVGGEGDVSNTERDVTVTPGTDFSGANLSGARCAPRR